MGISLFGSFSSYDRDPSPPVVERVVEKKVYVERLPNPNPKNFKILESTSIGRFLIVHVNYPDCTNYEGNKILIYENVTLNQLKKQGTVDPHFSENPDKFSPIARFVPTEKGWDMAVTFCDAMLFSGLA